jgi:hypothetical protein
MTRIDTPYGWNRRDFNWASNNNYWTASVYYDENGGPVHMSWVPTSVTKDNFDRAVRELIGEHYALADIRFNGDRWDAQVKRVGSRERKQASYQATASNATPLPFPSPVKVTETLKKHEIRDADTNAMWLEFHGQVPRAGEYFRPPPSVTLTSDGGVSKPEHLLFQVTSVLWMEHPSFPGTVFAVVYVRRSKSMPC